MVHAHEFIEVHPGQTALETNISWIISGVESQTALALRLHVQ